MGILDIFKSKNSDPKTALKRKKETEKFLKSINVPFIEHLPMIEDESEARIRKPNEIAERILILTYLNYISEEPDSRIKVIDFLKSNELWEKVSPDEKLLFENEELNEQENINISWRSEAIWVLLWTINKVKKIELPVEQVEISEIVSKLPKFMSDPTEFISTATIRPTSDILDFSDLIYRIHWATRNAELNNEKSMEFHPSIVVERHYAINWVTYYEEEWDEITTDT